MFSCSGVFQADSHIKWFKSNNVLETWSPSSGLFWYQNNPDDGGGTWSQQAATCPYPEEPEESSACPPSLVLQGAAFHVTHFESRITHVLYTAINTTEHGQVSQCLGFTKSLTSSIQRLGDVLYDDVSVTVNAKCYNHMLENFFLPEMRRRNWNMATAWFQQDGATAHTARLWMNTLRAAFAGRLLYRFGDIQWPSNSPDLTAADFFYGGIWKLRFILTPSLTLTALKMQFVRRLRMLRRTLYVASWQVYLGDGSNALIVMEDISKTLYWRREAFCESKTLAYLTVFSCIYCCIQ